MTNKKVLFVTLDGPRLTYLQSLFRPIFEGLRIRGYQFFILQITWGERDVHKDYKVEKRIFGGRYIRVLIPRWLGPFGYLITFISATSQAVRIIKKNRIGILMPRSVFPSLICMFASRFHRVELVLDADGLALDEKIDFAGKSAHALTYRLFRDVEAEAVRLSSAVLCRTKRAMKILQARAGAGTSLQKFFVVSNGRNPDVFHPFNPEKRSQVRALLGIEESAPFVVYEGSLGPQYCLKEMLRFFSALSGSQKACRFLILSSSHEFLNTSFFDSPGPSGAIVVKQVPPEEVPIYIASADLGLAFREHKFSTSAIAPIKVGEYLLCGLPIVSMTFTSSDGLIHSDCGFFLRDFHSDSIEAGASWFLNEVIPNRQVYRERARNAGLSYFSLEKSIEEYAVALGAVSPGE